MAKVEEKQPIVAEIKEALDGGIVDYHSDPRCRQQKKRDDYHTDLNEQPSELIFFSFFHSPTPFQAYMPTL